MMAIGLGSCCADDPRPESAPSVSVSSFIAHAADADGDRLGGTRRSGRPGWALAMCWLSAVAVANCVQQYAQPPGDGFGRWKAGSTTSTAGSAPSGSTAWPSGRTRGVAGVTALAAAVDEAGELGVAGCVGLVASEATGGVPTVGYRLTIGSGRSGQLEM